MEGSDCFLVVYNDVHWGVLWIMMLEVHSGIVWYGFGLWRLCVGYKRVYNHEYKSSFLYTELILPDRSSISLIMKDSKSNINDSDTAIYTNLCRV